MATRLVLGEKLDSAAADGLRDDILAAQSDDIVVDASHVGMIGGLCLEVLMSAHHLWGQNGKSFTLENPTADMIENLGRFGLAENYFERDVA